MAVQEIILKCAYFTCHILLGTKLDKIAQRVINSVICMRGSQECVYRIKQHPRHPKYWK